MIKPIETRYAGCRFRSRLEARWAVAFDHLGIEWEYEPEGFETSVGRYLPDFRIQVPGDGYPYWFEVKPPRAPRDDRHRVLCVETAMPTIVARGMPRSYADQLRGPRSALTAMLWGDRLTGATVPAEDSQPAIYPCAFIGQHYRLGPDRPGYCNGMWDSITKARPFLCSQEDTPQVALYVPDDEHRHAVPWSSSDVDCAYEAALSERFEGRRARSRSRAGSRPW